MQQDSAKHNSLNNNVLKRDTEEKKKKDPKALRVSVQSPDCIFTCTPIVATSKIFQPVLIWGPPRECVTVQMQSCWTTSLLALRPCSRSKRPRRGTLCCLSPVVRDYAYYAHQKAVSALSFFPLHLLSPHPVPRYPSLESRLKTNPPYGPHRIP